MNIQSLIAFTPFLAVFYLAFAFVQSLRKQRQGFGAALLALMALVLPLAALIFIQDMVIRSSLAGYLLVGDIYHVKNNKHSDC